MDRLALPSDALLPSALNIERKRAAWRRAASGGFLRGGGRAPPPASRGFHRAPGSRAALGIGTERAWRGERRTEPMLEPLEARGVEERASRDPPKSQAGYLSLVR